MKRVLISSSTITIFVMAINFIFKIELSYEIPKETLGLFYTFMDLVALGVMLFAGFKDSLIKAYDESNFSGVQYWYILIFWGIFILVSTFELLYYHYFFRDTIFSSFYLLLILFVNSLVLFFSFLNASFKIYKIMLFENFVFALSLITFYYLLSLIFSDKLEALFFAFVAGYFARTLYIFLLSPLKITPKKVEFSLAKNFLKNTLLSSLMYFFSFLFVSSTSLVILKLFGDKMFLAEYQVVIRSIFFSLVAIFVFPLNSFTFPEISKLISNGNFSEIERIERVLIKYLIIFFILMLISTLFTKWGVLLLFPEDYRDSYRELNIMLPLLPFIAYTTFAINIIKGFARFDLALYIRVVGSLIFFISIAISYTLDFSAKSVIYALDLSFFGMFALSLYFKNIVRNRR